MTEDNNAQGNSAATPAPAPAATAKPLAAKTASKPAAKPVTARKVVAKPVVAKPATKPATKPEAKPAVAPMASAAIATAKPRAARKRSAVDETVDKHQKVLADALEQAQAINYDRPKHHKQSAKPAKAEKPAKALKLDKPAKGKKTRLVRDSFAMPEAEYACIAELKKRLGGTVKKSELLRAGVAVLTALNNAELTAVMSHIERIKTGRPAKK